MILPIAAQWILGIAAVIAAAGVIWLALRRLYRIDAALPTLLQIADQFRPNEGDSLHDRISHIERTLVQIQRDFEPLMTERRQR